MPNTNLGCNVWYYDTNGAINNGKPAYISKIALWSVDTTNGQITMAIGTGISVVKLSFSNGQYVTDPWRQVDFSPPWYITNGSILSVTAGSGYVFLA